MKQTYTILVDGEVYGNLVDLRMCKIIAEMYLTDHKSVVIKDNKERTTVRRYIYGHVQPQR